MSLEVRTDHQIVQSKFFKLQINTYPLGKFYVAMPSSLPLGNIVH